MTSRHCDERTDRGPVRSLIATSVWRLELLTIRVGFTEILFGSSTDRVGLDPLVPSGIAIYGYIYDVASGRLIEVEPATTAGKPR